jgi:hypothetical protein
MNAPTIIHPLWLSCGWNTNEFPKMENHVNPPTSPFLYRGNYIDVYTCKQHKQIGKECEWFLYR